VNTDPNWITRKEAGPLVKVAVKTIDRAMRAGRIRLHYVSDREVYLWREDVTNLRALPSCPYVSPREA
jgi:predicted site-specific integrase-resolvase